MAPRRIVAGLIWAAGLCLFSATATPQPSAQLRTPGQVVAQARAHLTPRGASWAAGEAQRLRSGQITPQQVDRDAAAVADGLQPGADPDEMVLIALVEAQSGSSASPRQATSTMEGANAPEGNTARRTGSPALQRAIDDVVQKLTATQLPTPKAQP